MDRINKRAAAPTMKRLNFCYIDSLKGVAPGSSFFAGMYPFLQIKFASRSLQASRFFLHHRFGYRPQNLCPLLITDPDGQLHHTVFFIPLP